MPVSSPGTRTIFALLLLGPALFLVAFIALGTYYASAGVSAESIGNKVTQQIPYVLVFVLGVLGIALGTLAPLSTVALWRRSLRGPVVLPLLVGTVSGVFLAALYLLLLGPLISSLQSRIGDYVPPGSVLPAVSYNAVAFFLANVVLAPVVEESLYRGVALSALSKALGIATATVLTCLFFGLLHWAGGAWYMLLTATLAGGAFAALSLWQGSIVAPFAAHLTLNAIEFAYAAHGGA